MKHTIKFLLPQKNSHEAVGIKIRQSKQIDLIYCLKQIPNERFTQTHYFSISNRLLRYQFLNPPTPPLPTNQCRIYQSLNFFIQHRKIHHYGLVYYFE